MDPLDIVVRFHDIERFAELDRCIFSLMTQDYRALTISLVTQRFSPDALVRLNHMLRPLTELGQHAKLNIINYTHAEPMDARSAMLNLAASVASGRYFGLLDYDDTIYPEAYTRLTERLRISGRAVAFASVAQKSCEPFEDLLIVRSKTRPFSHRQFRDIFSKNFCPPHSYLLDRSRLDAADLHFEPTLTTLEDYHFLIRLCAKYPADSELLGTIIGDYYCKTDGSNTALTAYHQSEPALNAWKVAAEHIERLKSRTLVSEAVQRALGLRLRRGLTVADLSD